MAGRGGYRSGQQWTGWGREQRQALLVDLSGHEGKVVRPRGRRFRVAGRREKVGNSRPDFSFARPMRAVLHKNKVWLTTGIGCL